MTRQKWTTKEQETYLEDHKPAFLVANQNKSAAKEFFPTVVKEFRDRWPVPAPTQEEINDAGSLEFAMRVKKNKYDKVHALLSLLGKDKLILTCTAYMLLVSQQYSHCDV